VTKEEHAEVITIKKDGKKILVIKKLPRGNSAIKYGFTSTGQRTKGALITSEKADALIEKILKNQLSSGVEILGNIMPNALVQELLTAGKVVL
jgi:hypothetical protein